MKIDEAISRLEQARDFYAFHQAQEQVEAHQLGIETLKFYKAIRHGGLSPKMPLPGETPER